MSVGAVVFDLDGTLIDSRADIAHAVNHTRSQLGLPDLPLDVVMSFVGDGARLLLTRALQGTPQAGQLEQVFPEFLAYYTAHAADQTSAMLGVEQALTELASLPLPVALCTNKPRKTTLAVLEKLGWNRRFRAVVAGGDLPNHKPHPAPLLRISELLGLAPQSLVMVGDGPQDIECGHAVGARTVAVAGGFVEESLLRASRPSVWLDSMGDLPGLVRTWLKGSPRPLQAASS